MKRQGSALPERAYMPKKAKMTKSTPYKKQVILAPELKYLDTAFSTDATTTGAVISLSTLATGNTVLTRDGNKIVPKSFELRIRLELEAITQNAVIRFVLVRDRQANQVAVPAFNNVYDSITPESLRVIANLSRYDILMDKTVTMNTESGAVQKMFFKKYVKVKGDVVTSYVDNTAAVPVTNGYSLLYISDVAAGATDVNVFGQCRMRFVG